MGKYGLMFNNINDNSSEFLYNSQLNQQSNIVNIASLRATSHRGVTAKSLNPYVDKTEISASAIELFQRDCDINKFNKIAMSDSDDLSHLDLMKELFSQGVIDVYEDDVISQLVTNSRLRDDLEL